MTLTLRQNSEPIQSVLALRITWTLMNMPPVSTEHALSARPSLSKDMLMWTWASSCLPDGRQMLLKSNRTITEKTRGNTLGHRDWEMANGTFQEWPSLLKLSLSLGWYIRPLSESLLEPDCDKRSIFLFFSIRKDRQREREGAGGTKEADRFKVCCETRNHSSLEFIEDKCRARIIVWVGTKTNSKARNLEELMNLEGGLQKLC